MQTTQTERIIKAGTTPNGTHGTLVEITYSGYKLIPTVRYECRTDDGRAQKIPADQLDRVLAMIRE